MPPGPGNPGDSLDDVIAECLRRRDADGRLPLDEFCARHPQFADALRQRFGQAADAASASSAALHDRSHRVTGGQAHGALLDRLRTLAERGATARRYELQGEVARGGMGIVLRAFDKDLGRSLAMKVVRVDAGATATGEVDPQVLERFVEEAQITGQLDHPGVIPVHELGLDEQARAYFTMRLVRGRTAEAIFALARERAEGWTLVRAIEVLLKVCDTIAYAHSKGVVHRDLKPSNVMVGKYGEVYVMDWGLAKVLGKADPRDLRIRPPDSTLHSRVRTDRSKESESDPDSALRTMDGAIVGTPCYMPPEQANGQIEDVGVRSDVYAAGAMLYTLLTGVQPYLRPGSRSSPYMILEYVRRGPPPRVQELDPRAPAELTAICERAMARVPTERYASMGDLADDLRAYLEGRVVRAYRTGARAELASWVRRNRGMAWGIATAALALVVGAIAAVVYAQQADRARAAARGAQQAAEAGRQEADRARTAAQDEQQRAVAALAAAQQEQRLREAAETDLRIEGRRLRADLTQLRQQLRSAQSRARKSQAELRQLRTAEARLLHAFPAFEQLRPLEDFVAGFAAGDVTPEEQAVARHLRLLAAVTAPVADVDPDAIATLLDGAASLVRRDPGSARARLHDLQLPPPWAQACQRLVAIADWQLGDWQNAVAAQLRSNLDTAPDLLDNAAGAAWQQRNARELLDLLRDLADTQADAAAVRAAVADCAQRWSDFPALTALGAFLDGDAGPAAQQVAAPELAALALLHQGRIDAAFERLAVVERQPTLAAIVRHARIRLYLACHRPARARLELYGSTEGLVLPSLQRQHHQLLAQALAMAGDPAAAEPELRAAAALALPAAAPSPAAPAVAPQVLELRRQLGDGDIAAAQQQARQLRDRLGALDDELARAETLVLLAEVSLAAGASRQATADLGAAAAAVGRWWLAYGRCGSAAMSHPTAAALARLAMAATDCLARLAAGGEPLDADRIWQIAATFQDPVGTAWASRRAATPVLDGDGEWRDYEQARAAWLASRAVAPGPSPDDDDLVQREARLRAVAGSRIGALLPQLPSLAQVRSKLPPATCLVVFGSGQHQATAFVVAREGTELIALATPSSPAGAGDATAVMASVRNSRLLRTTARWHRLILVPARSLHALPLEAAVLAGGTTWPVDRIVTRAPSVSAWYDLAAAWRPRRVPDADTAAIAVVGGPSATALGSWWQTVLAPAAGAKGVRLVAAEDEPSARAFAAARGDACLGLSLPLARGAGGVAVPVLAAEPIAGAAAGEDWLRELRQTGTAARLCIVRAIGPAATAGDDDAAVADLVRDLWAAGCRTVITLPPTPAVDALAPMLAAVTAAIVRGDDPARAWSAATRQALDRGAAADVLRGARLWTSP